MQFGLSVRVTNAEPALGHDHVDLTINDVPHSVCCAPTDQGTTVVHLAKNGEVTSCVDGATVWEGVAMHVARAAMEEIAAKLRTALAETIDNPE